MLEQFDKAVRGMKVGESKTFPLQFPADYHGKPTWPARKPTSW
jgi:trigger factor